jgi:hypothetical protein
MVSFASVNLFCFPFDFHFSFIINHLFSTHMKYLHFPHRLSLQKLAGNCGIPIPKLI